MDNDFSEIFVGMAFLKFYKKDLVLHTQFNRNVTAETKKKRINKEEPDTKLLITFVITDLGNEVVMFAHWILISLISLQRTIKQHPLLL